MTTTNTFIALAFAAMFLFSFLMGGIAIDQAQCHTDCGFHLINDRASL